MKETKKRALNNDKVINQNYPFILSNTVSLDQIRSTFDLYLSHGCLSGVSIFLFEKNSC